MSRQPEHFRQNARPGLPCSKSSPVESNRATRNSWLRSRNTGRRNDERTLFFADRRSATCMVVRKSPGVFVFCRLRIGLSFRGDLQLHGDFSIG